MTLPVVCLLTLLSGAGEGEWKLLGPGGGGWIQSMTAHPTDSRTLLLGCDVGGFYLTNDAGRTWGIHNTGLHDYFVESIAVQPDNPEVIFLGTQSGIHRSTNGGRTWQWLRNGWPELQRGRRSAPVSVVVIDPKRPNTVYAGIGRPRFSNEGQGRVYKTTDGGDNWFVVNADGSLPQDAVITDLAIHPRNSDTLFVCSQHGLFRSDDAGVTWKKKYRGLPHDHVRRLAICETQPARMYLTLHADPYATPWQGGVYRSDDEGESWRVINEGLRTRPAKPGKNANLANDYDCVVVHPGNPDIAYVGGTTWVTAYLYRTTDGERWQPVTQGQTPGAFDRGWINFCGAAVKCLAMSPADPNVLWFGTSMHVFRSEDGGDHWVPCHGEVKANGTHPNNGLAVTCLHHVRVHPQDRDSLYFGFYDIGLLQSRDGGQSWRRTMQGIPREFSNGCFCVAFDPDDPSRMWGGFGAWKTNTGTVGHSQDGGVTWKTVETKDSGLPNGRNRCLLIDPRSPPGKRRLYATVDGHGVYIGEDNGTRWHAASKGLPNGNIQGLVQHPSHPGTLLCVLGASNAGPGHVFRTNDDAQTWQQIDSGKGFGDVRDFAISPSDPNRLCVAVRRGWAGSKPNRHLLPGGLFVSNDGGASWTRAFEDHFVQCVAMAPDNADLIFVGAHEHPYHDEPLGNGVWMSSDGGKTWQSLNDESLSLRQITAIHVDARNPLRLYVGTAGNSGFVREFPNTPSIPKKTRSR